MTQEELGRLKGGTPIVMECKDWQGIRQCHFARWEVGWINGVHKFKILIGGFVYDIEDIRLATNTEIEREIKLITDNANRRSEDLRKWLGIYGDAEKEVKKNMKKLRGGK